MENEKNEVIRLSDSRDSSKRRMFKAAFQIGIFLSFALIFSLQSCGSKSSSSNGSDDNNGLSAEFGTSTDSGNKKGYEIVPLVWTVDSTVLKIENHYLAYMYDHYRLGEYFTLKDNKGDYIVFDNDEDYIEYCPEISFITGVYWDNNNKCEENMGIRESRGELRKEELNKAYEYIERLINGVDSYLSGNKEDISDPVLFEQIDKYYYNNKDYLFDFYCSKSGYNNKEYDSRRSHLAVIPRKESETRNILFTINGEDIPSNAVVITTRYTP